MKPSTGSVSKSNKQWVNLTFFMLTEVIWFTYLVDWLWLADVPWLVLLTLHVSRNLLTNSRSHNTVHTSRLSLWSRRNPSKTTVHGLFVWSLVKIVCYDACYDMDLSIQEIYSPSLVLRAICTIMWSSILAFSALPFRHYCLASVG